MAPLLAVLVWSVGIEPRLIDERSTTASIRGLPAAWEGVRLALVADFQVGMWMANTDTVERVIRRLMDGRPSAVLIAGDFLYHPTEGPEENRNSREELDTAAYREMRSQIAEVVALLKPLTAAGVPSFAVLGNHDYAMRSASSRPLPLVADELSSALMSTGVTVLRNDAAPMGSRDKHLPTEERLYIVGLDAWIPGATDIGRALAGVPAGAPRVLLMHNPASFQHLPPHSAPVALAGHTHGGQIRVPFASRWSWMSLVEESAVAADGWIAPSFGLAGNRLYVNRGIGFSVAPVRLNCRPELTWITLTRGSGVAR